MKTAKHNQSFYLFAALLAFLLYLLDSTGLMTLRIATAHPLLLLPLTVAVAMRAREWAGLEFGGFLGILLDITAADSFCFNLVSLALIGCICGLLSSYYVNNNIYSALVLSLCSSLAYFTAKWLVFYVFSGRNSVFEYFVNYSLMSAIYTSLFILPFYYLVRFMSKRLTGRE